MLDKTIRFVEKAKKVHGDKYDYTSTVYFHSMQPLTVTCREHGDFEIRPNGHLSSKQGCQKCSKRHRPSLEEFVAIASAVHGNKYNYSKVVYTNNKTKVEIVCPEHGSFLQPPRDHIHSRSGCPSCKKLVTGRYHKKNTEWFVTTARSIHGDKYDYTRVDYQRYHDKVEIVCGEHGSFFQTAGSHIHNKSGCPTCSYKDYEGGYGKKRFESHPELKTKSGMLYVIECRSELEHFVKIGITQHDLEHRFKKCNRLPYMYTMLTSVTGTLYDMFLLEQRIKKQFKTFKYRPRLKFNGHTECLTAECTSNVLQAIVTEKSIFK